ncbi:hypothetical protein VJ923_07175 [Adlercreutzia sp. R25]|uniref:hypothetical protein n=1 Tax=Adlercreutzia shanghongiae TaxID=3111773 RepID=UPI002DBEC778|nr:hypothetical protein [Adlercreutzia sp. R25]MEC4272935.1 hypothetical protein [Adlercreutzia sp. R25]
MMDLNTLVVCITVVIVAIVAAAAVLGVAEQYAKIHRPMTLRELVCGIDERGGKSPEDGEGRNE